MPGITFPTSVISDHNGKQYRLSKTGCKWAVYKTSLGNDQWEDEIVALETDFSIPTDAKYTDSDKSRLLRDFMKFVLPSYRCASNMADCRHPVTSVVRPKTTRLLSSQLVSGRGLREVRTPTWDPQSNRSPTCCASQLASPTLLRNLLSYGGFIHWSSKILSCTLTSVASLLNTETSFNPPVQNHAEFVSIQTVDALAHNSWVATGKIDTGYSLVEILGIATIGPGDAPQRLILQDDVWPNWL